MLISHGRKVSFSLHSFLFTKISLSTFPISAHLRARAIVVNGYEHCDIVDRANCDIVDDDHGDVNDIDDDNGDVDDDNGEIDDDNYNVENADNFAWKKGQFWPFIRFCLPKYLSEYISNFSTSQSKGNCGQR